MPAKLSKFNFMLYKCNSSRMPKRAFISTSWAQSADITQKELQKTPDRAIGARPITHSPVFGIESKFFEDGTTKNYQRIAAGCISAMLNAIFWVRKDFSDCHKNGHVFWSATGQYTIYGDIPNCHSRARRLYHADLSIKCVGSVFQEFSDSKYRWWDYRQSVRPAFIFIDIIYLFEAPPCYNLCRIKRIRSIASF